MLLSLLLLPLEVPVLILGAGVVARAIAGMPIVDLLSIMMGLAMLALALAPIAIAASIRISLEV
jgi:heme exporter protein B